MHGYSLIQGSRSRHIASQFNSRTNMKSRRCKIQLKSQSFGINECIFYIMHILHQIYFIIIFFLLTTYMNFIVISCRFYLGIFWGKKWYMPFVSSTMWNIGQFAPEVIRWMNKMLQVIKYSIFKIGPFYCVFFWHFKVIIFLKYSHMNFF